MEWRRAERFVSGSAPDGRGATRPFVDVQSVLCRTATFTVARLLNLKELLIDQQAAIDKTGSPCRGVRHHARLALAKPARDVPEKQRTQNGECQAAGLKWTLLIQ